MTAKGAGHRIKRICDQRVLTKALHQVRLEVELDPTRIFWG